MLSRTLQQHTFPDVTIIGENAKATIAALKSAQGKDIWLFGGGSLFRSLLAADLVDTVEPTIIPVLLGAGIPFLAAPADRATLSLISHKAYKSGIVSLEYAVGGH